MPTDMCALEDFDEPDKLHIQINDVITIIEGRWVRFTSSGVDVGFTVFFRSCFMLRFSPSGRRTTGGEVRTNGLSMSASSPETW